MKVPSRQDRISQAKEAALRYLGNQDRTVYQVRRKLGERGFEQAVIESALADLRRARLLDDRAFARRWIESRMANRPAGELRFEQDLNSRGVAPDIIAEVLAEFDETVGSEGAAMEVLRRHRRRFAGLGEEKARLRMWGLLSRRGFDADTSQRAVDQILAEEAGRNVETAEEIQ